MQLIAHVFYRQLEFEFTIQVYDIAIHILEQEHQSIKSANHRYTNVSHRSTIVGRWIVNDHRGEQIIVVLVAIFISEDRTNDEYTWITWRFRVMSITFDS